jgi:hypothetical protein
MARTMPLSIMHSIHVLLPHWLTALVDDITGVQAVYIHSNLDQAVFAEKDQIMLKRDKPSLTPVSLRVGLSFTQKQLQFQLRLLQRQGQYEVFCFSRAGLNCTLERLWAAVQKFNVDFVKMFRLTRMT